MEGERGEKGRSTGGSWCWSVVGSEGRAVFMGQGPILILDVLQQHQQRQGVEKGFGPREGPELSMCSRLLCFLLARLLL